MALPQHFWVYFGVYFWYTSGYTFGSWTAGWSLAPGIHIHFYIYIYIYLNERKGGLPDACTSPSPKTRNLLRARRQINLFWRWCVAEVAGQNKTKNTVQESPSWCRRKRVTRRCNIPQANALRRVAGGQTRAYEGPGANTSSSEPKVRPNELYKRRQ